MQTHKTNATKYASPNSYYDITTQRPLLPLLEEALQLFGNGTGKTALDLGCGAGAETKYLLQNGFIVTAVDGNPSVKEFINKLPEQDRLTLVISAMEDFRFKKYDFINASRSLPFAHKDTFTDLFMRLKNSLLINGVFSGHFFGINDQWNKPDETMSFVDRDTALKLLDGLEIIKFDEIEELGKLANGTPKYWHKFDIIARKN